MKRAWLWLALAACGGDERLPGGLVFEERTIQLQPDTISPTFTMRVPRSWHQSRALVSGDAVVFGDGAIDADWQSKTFLRDPDDPAGTFQLGISCEGDCATALQRSMLESYAAHETIEDRQTSSTDRTIVFRDPDGDDDVFVIRIWWPAGETRFRFCGGRVKSNWASAWRAFANACEGIVER